MFRAPLVYIDVFNKQKQPTQFMGVVKALLCGTVLTLPLLLDFLLH